MKKTKTKDKEPEMKEKITSYPKKVVKKPISIDSNSPPKIKKSSQ